VTAYQAGDSPFPVEASILYRDVVAGSGYAPRARSVELTARIYAPVLWHNRRVAADTARPHAPERPTDARPSIPAPDSSRTVPPDSAAAPRPVVVPPPEAPRPQPTTPRPVVVPPQEPRPATPPAGTASPFRRD
jgi:hypothetical protein